VIFAVAVAGIWASTPGLAVRAGDRIAVLGERRTAASWRRPVLSAVGLKGRSARRGPSGLGRVGLLPGGLTVEFGA
jgi:hypothetical protein